MNKGRLHNPDRQYMLGFFLCAALFIAGCIAGAVASGALPQDTPINEFLEPTTAAGNFGGRFLASLLTTGKFHALVLFFAFSVFGIAAIPAVSALRGFLLCFAISSILRSYGAAYVPHTLLMFAPEVILAVPALFLLSTHSFVSSCSLLRIFQPRSSAQPPFFAVFLKRAALVLALLCLSALIDAAAAPWLATHFVK